MVADGKKLPESWVVAELQDVCKILDSQRIPVNNRERTKRIQGKAPEDLYPYYGATGQVGAIDDYIFNGEHVLLGEDGAPFLDPLKDKAYLVDGRFWVNNHAHILKAKISNKYLCYYLNQVDYSEYVTGTTRLKLNQAMLRKISIAFPPDNEQHRIVAKIEALFSELDKGVESLKTAREQLKIYRQAVLKHAFEGKLTARWREENADKLESPEQLLARIQQEREARYQQQLQEWKAAVKAWEKNGKEGKKPPKPKHKEISRLSEEESSLLPELPTGYFYTYLSNLGELGRGKSKHRPRNAPELFGGKYPFIQTGEVKAANRVIRTYSQTYNETGLAQSHLWPKGTLCITIAANIAETAFLGIDACFPDSVVGFTALESVVLPEYVDFFIKAVRVQIEAYAPATAQKNINLATLENLVIPLCSAAEQRCLVDKIEALLSVADKNEAEIELALRRAETLRQSILKKAFSGQLILQHPNNEPATGMSERIRTEQIVPSKIMHGAV